MTNLRASSQLSGPGLGFPTTSIAAPIPWRQAASTAGAAAAEAGRTTGVYEYDAAALFGLSNVMLTEFAQREIQDKQAAHQGDLLRISVPPQSGDNAENRLRQWEKVAARSAVIADSFVAAGKDGRMIEAEMPERMLSNAETDGNISLVFLSPEKDQVAP